MGRTTPESHVSAAPLQALKGAGGGGGVQILGFHIHQGDVP